MSTNTYHLRRLLKASELNNPIQQDERTKHKNYTQQQNNNISKKNYYNYNLFSLIFANVIIIFISLNNILSFTMPNIFISYLFYKMLYLKK